jgi:hypothetical protein
MRGRQALAISAAEWDQVWAEYDARQPRLAVPEAPLPSRPAMAEAPPPAPARRRGLAGLALGLAGLAGVAWLAASGATVWQVAQAMERQDAATLAGHLDVGAVRAGLRDHLARLAERTTGEQAGAFLGGMADEMAEALATPGALAEVARMRGVSAGAAADGMFAARPVGLTALEVPIGTSIGSATPLTLRLELTEAGPLPRWQVTEVRIGAGARTLPAAPPVRLSQLR